MSIRLDINWYKILGIPEPTKYPRDPVLGEIKPLTEGIIKWRAFCLWIKENQILLTLIGIILAIVLTSLLRVHRGGK